KQLFTALREDKPLTTARPAEKTPVEKVDVPPERIRVQVYNGTAQNGLGSTLDAALHATGFDTTRAPLTAPRHDLKRTLVTYDPRWDRSAKTLAAALPGAELRAVAGQGATMRVTAGEDAHTVRRVRAEEPAGGRFGAVKGDEVVCP